MNPIFTIHAGEYVFGETVEKRFSDVSLWIPAKDTGIDFLITGKDRKRTVAVQVKMSRDYRPQLPSSNFERKQIAGGWFVFTHKKLSESPADIWSLILVSREKRIKPYFVNISPSELLKRLVAIHGKHERYHLYPWVMETRQCIEGRGLKKQDKELIASNEYNLGMRDFTSFLDDWSFLSRLRARE